MWRVGGWRGDKRANKVDIASICGSHVTGSGGGVIGIRLSAAAVCVYNLCVCVFVVATSLQSHTTT